MATTNDTFSAETNPGIPPLSASSVRAAERLVSALRPGRSGTVQHVGGGFGRPGHPEVRGCRVRLDKEQAMPELPEVETLRRGLERHLIGRTVGTVHVRVAKMIKGTFADPAVFGERLQGARIESVGRRGKHLIIGLHSGYHLLLHLNMRGQLLVTSSEAPETKYLAVAFAMDDGQELRFHDMWTWGEVRLMSSEELAAHPALSSMGPEPFSEEWTPRQLSAGLARRPKTAIKAVLLDQGLVAGVGNIYADESLHRAGIHPLRAAASLNETETESLHREIRAVLHEATDGGGTTSDNYVDAEGQIGRYAPRVYDRNGQPCLSCGRPLTKIRVTGRGTVYCASCQT